MAPASLRSGTCLQCTAARLNESRPVHTGAVDSSNFAKPAFMDTEELRIFEEAAARFLDEHASPGNLDRWRQQGSVDRELWNLAGSAGLLGIMIPEAYGGSGADFRYEIILIEQLARTGAYGFSAPLHNAVVAPYLLSYASESQKRAWLPDIVSGKMVLAIAMSEPAAGSDLQGMKTTAVRSADTYVLNGQKTFISNGLHASLIVIAAKTDQKAGAKGISLFAVDVDQVKGFSRGRLLEKLGQESRDTTELFFNDMRIPVDALLGGVEGRGFAMLMEKLPQERLVIAWQALAMIDAALATTMQYVRDRKAFGKRLLDFQNSQFMLAECATEARIARVFLNHCTEQLLAGSLNVTTASMAKLWVTEAQGRIIDKCLQLHGGYGYMLEYPIARMYRDARAYRIYGGANEIMKILIARTL
jgi:acyl-CoA dehydrogenase